MTDTRYIEEYLLGHAPLKHFWILSTENVQPGLVHFMGADGTPYVLMDDDDERVEKCIEFLEDMGCPVFADLNEEERYAAQLGDASK
ncbi:hypothetical protein [Symmachiella dynata]|uniref:hypothetical protein n=1 Tax=Symmachiella dynata TaxID=2527995 RepID=UPI0030ECC70F